MLYRRLGKSGLKVSALSYGSWVTFAQQMDDTLAEQCMTAAWDAGCNFFDNAEAYADGESERSMGRVLAKLGWPRAQYVVSSKVFWGGDKPNEEGLSRKHVFEACHAALKRLQVDYLDLYFCHRPDPETPIEETVMAINDLVRQGKVLYWGTSEWSAEQIQQAYDFAKANFLVPPTMEQPEYSLLKRRRVEVEYAPLYNPAGVGLGTTIWSPLASGLLTGKYRGGQIPADSRLSLPRYDWLKKAILEDPEASAKFAAIELFGQLADELSVSMAHLALAWCLKNPQVSTVITGASRVEQVVDNMKAIEALPKLTDEVMTKISAIFPMHA